MAIIDPNLNATAVRYFKLYNENASNLSTLSPAATTVPSPLTRALTRTPLTPSTPVLAHPPTTATTLPQLAAATTLSITSTLVNTNSSSSNASSSQNYHSNYTNNNNSHNNNDSSSGNSSISNQYFNNYTSTLSNFNQSTLYQYRNLSSNASSDDNNYNDSAKISYESGSNFMLLLEDFGEYFYNYNGSDYNSSISIYQANCSLTNSTSCGDVTARESSFFA
jgi:hypothetical protein